MHQPPSPRASTIEVKIKAKWKALSDIGLTNDRVIPCQKCEPEKAEHKKTGENEDAVDEPFLGGEMHENERDQADFEGGDEDRDGDVLLSTCFRRNVNAKEPRKEPAEVDI